MTVDVGQWLLALVIAGAVILFGIIAWADHVLKRAFSPAQLRIVRPAGAAIVVLVILIGVIVRTRMLTR